MTGDRLSLEDDGQAQRFAARFITTHLGPAFVARDGQAFPMRAQEVEPLKAAGLERIARGVRQKKWIDCIAAAALIGAIYAWLFAGLVGREAVSAGFGMISLICAVASSWAFFGGIRAAERMVLDVVGNRTAFSPDTVRSMYQTNPFRWASITIGIITAGYVMWMTHELTGSYDPVHLMLPGGTSGMAGTFSNGAAAPMLARDQDIEMARMMKFLPPLFVLGAIGWAALLADRYWLRKQRLSTAKLRR